ncbi:MAG: DUF4157 domain-containing protein [Deltaproteobacteria bacterium]|nr:MAG: DUF4157 domain-containing protein [Deltaproteobacteria bacterium]
MNGGFDRKPGGSSLVDHAISGERGAGTPGKQTLTARLVPSTGAVQLRKTGPSDEASAAPGGADDPTGVTDAAMAGISGTGGSLPHADKIQAAFGPSHDVSSIRAHVGGAAAAATARMGAEAYASGNHVAFASAPSLHTAAHEVAHVMQQREGVQLLGGVGKTGDVYERNADAVADRVVAGQSAADLLPRSSRGGSAAVQMRRLPTNTGEMLNDPAHAGQPGANYTANATGTRRLIQLAEAELTPAQRVQVDTATLAGQSQAEFDALPEPTRLTRRVDAIRSVRPDLTLGDPMLIDTGPRPATPDAANITTLCNGANAIFDAIATGHDTDLDQVFGSANRHRDRSLGLQPRGSARRPHRIPAPDRAALALHRRTGRCRIDHHDDPRGDARGKQRRA